MGGDFYLAGIFRMVGLILVRPVFGGGILFSEQAHLFCSVTQNVFALLTLLTKPGALHVQKRLLQFTNPFVLLLVLFRQSFYVEAPLHHGDTEFCGCSLYRAQPPRNPKFAPKHYVEQAAGKFIPHTPEEQQQIMRDYCGTLTSETIVCYCHYCLEGLLAGGADGRHLAQLLFAPGN